MSEPRSDFRLIGDPHITRKFEFGVPLARRGEREELLFDDFRKKLQEGPEPILIVVGDLFEKPIVSLQDLHETIQILLCAAAMRPDRMFFIMAGNHDISPQSQNYGAFHILYTMNGITPNLHFVMKPKVYEGIAMFPWEWDRDALRQLDDIRGQKIDTAVGHWDLVAYDENHTEHLCPAKELVQMGAKAIYSGHWHIAGDYKVDGLTVHCTGSMQPMTHAEDPDSKLYVTMTVEEYEEADPETLKDKYVRVTAAPGVEVDALDDCLGFKVLRTAEETGEEDRYDVDIGEFKVDNIIDKNLRKHEVPAEVSTFIKERISVDT